MMLFVSLTIFSGCKKESTSNEPIKKNETMAIVDAFQPSNKVIVENGMLTFCSKLAFDVTKREIASAKRTSVNLWEKSLGIKTPESIFNEVVIAEDSISDYFMSLPESEQEYWRNQAQSHSTIYKEALAQKTICLLPDGEGGEYFDLNLYDKTAASLINLEGFVKIENKIYQYTDNAIKIIQDGDAGKTKLIKNINHSFIGNDMIVNIFNSNRLKSTSDWDSNNWTQDMNFYEFDSNWRGRYQKRVKVWIDGHSEPAGTPVHTGCYEYLNCTFILRAEAQKRNFWGTWVYSGYWPNLTFSAEWNCDYWTFADVTSGCGLRDTWYPYVTSGNRTSPIVNENFGGVNNAFIELAPHGIWQSSPIFFSRPFFVHGTVTCTLGPLTKTYTWQ